MFKVHILKWCACTLISSVGSLSSISFSETILKKIFRLIYCLIDFIEAVFIMYSNLHRIIRPQANRKKTSKQTNEQKNPTNRRSSYFFFKMYKHVEQLTDSILGPWWSVGSQF